MENVLLILAVSYTHLDVYKRQIIDMSNKCLEDFDGAISHYKELVEKEQQC